MTIRTPGPGPAMPVFDDSARTDHSPRRPNEGAYAFLNQSAKPHFAEVRRLISEWVGQFPLAHRKSLINSMQSGGDHAFESAFWELYLHEAYRRAGYHVTVHPIVAGSMKHPDFLMENDESRFYLEAVRANVSGDTLSEKRRLDDVHTLVDNLPAEKFVVRFTYDAIGARSLGTTELRSHLMQWLASLDPEAVSARYASNPRYHSLPQFPFEKDGWSLEFTAVPLRPEAYGKGRGLVGMFGAGRATGVDNVTPLARAVDAKANRYGVPDAPLVIAIMANTEYPTRSYEIERTLYGLSAARPRQASAQPSGLFEDGHWLTRRGWRRGHAPQVVTACGLKPWNVTTVQPALWSTLEPGVVIPVQPRWLAPVSVDTPEPTISPGQPMNELFGLPADWLSGDAF